MTTIIYMWCVARFGTKRLNGVRMVGQNAVLTLECVGAAKSGKRFSHSVCMAFELLFDICSFAWLVHDVAMAC